MSLLSHTRVPLEPQKQSILRISKNRQQNRKHFCAKKYLFLYKSTNKTNYITSQNYYN